MLCDGWIKVESFDPEKLENEERCVWQGSGECQDEERHSGSERFRNKPCGLCSSSGAPSTNSGIGAVHAVAVLT